MKKIILLLTLITTGAFGQEYSDYKCQKLQKDGNVLITVTQRCENKEVVCYETQSTRDFNISIWCYKK